MSRPLLLMFAALAALPLLFASAAPSPAVSKGADYILTTRQPDGNFGTTGIGQTWDAIFALRSAGINVAAISPATADTVNRFARDAVKPAAAGKAALAVRALGSDPRQFGGTDLIANIQAGYSSASGEYAADVFSQSIAMLGLACTGNNVPAGAIAALRKSQLADGGWGFGGESDPDTAAIAAQALVASGVPRSDASLAKALAYFRAKQGNDAGWGFDPNESNTSSTAFVVQALIALGEDPAAYRKGSATPTSYLLSQQQPDGSFAGFDPGFATNQVLPALAGRTFCNAPDTPIAAAPPATPAPAQTPRPPAPLPPNTGSGLAAGSGAPGPWLAIAIAVLGAAAFVPLAVRRR